jgi:hypothetical protein
MDIEREESEAESRRKKEERPEPEMYEKPGRCEICGRETKILYRFNVKNVCWYCLEKEDEYAGGKPSGGAVRVLVTHRRKRKKGLIEKLVDRILGRPEEEEVEEEEKQVGRVVPIRKERITEGPEEAEKEEIVEMPEEERGPVIQKEGEPEEKEEKEEEKKKKPDWSQWKED